MTDTSERPDPNTVPMDKLVTDGGVPETFTVIVPSPETSMRFIRAQGSFIRAMSYFMDEGRNVADDKEYINHITGYATAQGLFIAAQQDFLKALGAL
jgi:hypothetical protein